MNLKVHPSKLRQNERGISAGPPTSISSPPHCQFKGRNQGQHGGKANITEISPETLGATLTTNAPAELTPKSTKGCRTSRRMVSLSLSPCLCLSLYKYIYIYVLKHM